MWNLKRNYINGFTYKIETDSQTSRISLWWLGEGWREGIVREFGTDMYILIYFKWMNNKNLLNNTWNYTQCYVVAWIGGEFGGEWIQVYVWLSPFAVHVKLSQHCLSISYNLILKNSKKFLNVKCC